MNEDTTVEFDDMQALLRFGHGHLRDSCIYLLTIKDVTKFGTWMQTVPITTARASAIRPDSAVQIAITSSGLKKIGLPTSSLNSFPDEFIVGMTGDKGRSRRLGDVYENAPEHWFWGHHDAATMHILLLLYAKENQLDSLKQTIRSPAFESAFYVLHELPTDTLTAREPFGFVDGISQPVIDWALEQSTDVHKRATYSNLLAPGEIVLGYPNEYGQLTNTPQLGAADEPALDYLPLSSDSCSRYDLGRNGSYLVIRQLEQDLDGFSEFIKNNSSNGKTDTDGLAALMVGRERDGRPLVATSNVPIPGISASNINNNFNYDADPLGRQCPLGSHLRRSNPRTGDFPPGVTGLFSRFVRSLGFGRKSEYEDVTASSRFHRILRRGRTYGIRKVDSLSVNNTKDQARGLQFMCLASNIVRQFEFVQSAWCTSSTFAGMHEQRDPLIAHRQPLHDGSATNNFSVPSEKGTSEKFVGVPQFVTVRGGGYFFMPGIRAIKYLSQLAQRPPPVKTSSPDELV